MCLTHHKRLYDKQVYIKYQFFCLEVLNQTKTILEQFNRGKHWSASAITAISASSALLLRGESIYSSAIAVAATLTVGLGTLAIVSSISLGTALTGVLAPFVIGALCAAGIWTIARDIKIIEQKPSGKRNSVII